MDIADQHSDDEVGFEDAAEIPHHRTLPSDLPKSLDDRQPIRHYAGETEMYDAWQGNRYLTRAAALGGRRRLLTHRSGQSQLLTSPMPAQPLAFNLSLDDDRDDDDDTPQRLEDNDTRLMEMLAAQAAHREDGSAAGDEEAIAADKKLSDLEKKAMLQKSLHNAASNGDVDQVGRVLQGPARQYVDINGPDEEGTAPIIYASCFVSSRAKHLCWVFTLIDFTSSRVTKMWFWPF